MPAAPPPIVHGPHERPPAPNVARARGKLWKKAALRSLKPGEWFQVAHSWYVQEAFERCARQEPEARFNIYRSGDMLVVARCYFAPVDAQP